MTKRVAWLAVGSLKVGSSNRLKSLTLCRHGIGIDPLKHIHALPGFCVTVYYYYYYYYYYFLLLLL